MQKNITIKEKVKRILINSPDELFKVTELATLTSLTKRQVARALQTLCNEGIAKGFRDQYIRGNELYYGLTEEIYNAITS